MRKRKRSESSSPKTTPKQQDIPDQEANNINLAELLTWQAPEIQSWLVSIGHGQIAPFFEFSSGKVLARLQREDIVDIVDPKYKILALSLYRILQRARDRQAALSPAAPSPLALPLPALPPPESPSEVQCESAPFIPTSVPTSAPAALALFPPQNWTTFEEEMSLGTRQDVGRVWDELFPRGMHIDAQKDFYWPLKRILKGILKEGVQGGLESVFIDKKVPEVVILPGEDWQGERLKGALVDFKMVGKFNPESAVAVPVVKENWYGDASQGFYELLLRSSAAFEAGRERPYYGVVSDFNHIVFWKFEWSGEKIKPSFLGPKKFCWEYNKIGNRLKFGGETVPEGFILLCRLVITAVKGARTCVTEEQEIVKVINVN